MLVVWASPIREIHAVVKAAPASLVLVLAFWLGCSGCPQASSPYACSCCSLARPGKADPIKQQLATACPAMHTCNLRQFSISNWTALLVIPSSMQPASFKQCPHLQVRTCATRLAEHAHVETNGLYCSKHQIRKCHAFAHRHYRIPLLWGPKKRLVFLIWAAMCPRDDSGVRWDGTQTGCRLVKTRQIVH